MQNVSSSCWRSLNAMGCSECHHLLWCSKILLPVPKWKIGTDVNHHQVSLIMHILLGIYIGVNLSAEGSVHPRFAFIGLECELSTCPTSHLKSLFFFTLPVCSLGSLWRQDEVLVILLMWVIIMLSFFNLWSALQILNNESIQEETISSFDLHTGEQKQRKHVASPGERTGQCLWIVGLQYLYQGMMCFHPPSDLSELGSRYIAFPPSPGKPRWFLQAERITS